MYKQMLHVTDKDSHKQNRTYVDIIMQTVRNVSSS